MVDVRIPVQPQTGARERLLAKVASLDDSTCQVLETMVDMLGSEYQEAIAPDSDLVAPAFAKNFRTRLQLHHATSEEPLKKKPFEFAFKAACIAAGSRAEIVENDVNPGHDVSVDGIRISLKTEGGRNISEGYIKISKYMEARWIRECHTGQDFHQHLPRILTHLGHYERVFVLRIFRVEQPFHGFRYILVEIPLSLLKLVGNITPMDFSARTANGSSTASVKDGGVEVFKLRLDGSVEKVTIERLSVTRCKLHASWTVPVLLGGSPGDE